MDDADEKNLENCHLETWSWQKPNPWIGHKERKEHN